MKLALNRLAICAALAALAATAPSGAFAGIGALTDIHAGAIAPPVLRGGVGFIGTGFEADQGWLTGPLNGQQAWAASPAFDVVATNKNGSVNSLQVHKNTGAAQGSSQLAFSPLNLDNLRTQVCFDFKMDDAAGANYSVIGQAPSQSLLTWRVEFDFGGHVFVVDRDQTGQLAYVDTGLSWGRFTWDHFQIDVGDQAIEYRRNGELFYTGERFGGTANEQLVVRSDNYQDFAGNTSISGGPIAAYIDNIELRAVPGPGALALLGLGGLVAMRRRRG